MKIIKVKIGSTGKVVIETEGFHGASCQEATRAIEAALGGAKAETLKAEYYQQEVTHEETVSHMQ